jgi:glycosyltransferase involved in cell wall biosynthesis
MEHLTLSKTKNSKVIVVMPAYNAEHTLRKTIEDIPLFCVDEIILVDDASRDNTVSQATSIGNSHPQLTISKEEYSKGGKTLLTISTFSTNKGYGANQKECYNIALAHGAEIIVMVHPDYQYDPKIIKYFVGFITEGHFDVMLGSRIRSRKEALAGGMPIYKYVSNRFLSLVENLVTGRVLTDWHTGMRAYHKKVLESVPYHTFSNDFIFDTQMLLAIAEREYSTGDIPVPVRYFKEASSINFKRSLRYGILTLWETSKFIFRTYF